jgi:S1-C subfamily serine protease
MRDAKNGKQTNTGSDVIYRYFATYWAKLAKPSLGVHVKVPQKDEVSQGLQVLVVMEDSPAKTIGLMKGDVLLSIGELQLANVTDLSKALNQYAGQTVDIVYTRDNMRFDEKISLN